MTNFEYAVGKVLEVEKGFINHPLDRGGPTNFGITQTTLEHFRGKPVTPADVAALTKEEAIEIYQKLFWNRMELNRIFKRRLAYILFDQGVNGGTVQAIKTLQECLNALNYKPIAVDGVLGEETELAVYNAAFEPLCQKLIEAFQIRYVRIVENNTSQIVFLEGWLRRTFGY